MTELLVTVMAALASESVMVTALRDFSMTVKNWSGLVNNWFFRLQYIGYGVKLCPQQKHNSDGPRDTTCGSNIDQTDVTIINNSSDTTLLLEVFTLSHLFRVDSTQNARNPRNPLGNS